MSNKNRIDTWGQVHANKSKGSQGIIHNEHKEIIATHRIQGWVTCQLRFKGRKRKIMSAGTYSELFFLDEVTAFSAMHRPCAECRRERYLEFKEKWLEANIQLFEGNKPTGFCKN
jgi:hypothetical protein